MEEIKVMNRKNAIKLSYKIPNDSKKYAIISISELSDPSPHFNHSSNLISVLKLNFDDVDKNENGNYCMTEKDAKKIAEFIRYFAPKIDCLVVHCLAGRSRSAACAAAISKWYFEDDSLYFQQYNPNMLVYRLTLNALMEG